MTKQPENDSIDPNKCTVFEIGSYTALNLGFRLCRRPEIFRILDTDTNEIGIMIQPCEACRNEMDLMFQEVAVKMRNNSREKPTLN